MSIAKDLEVWTAQTLCDTGILLSVIAWALHLGRPYFERILGRFTLRVASDLWWMLYVLVRDGALFGAAILGFLTLNLDLMADIKIGLPFVPLGTLALFAALLTKVFRNTEDVNRAHLRMFQFVGLGALLNGIGYVLVMESPGSEYAASRMAAWAFLDSLRSNKNPALATWTFYGAMGALVILGVWASLQSARLLRKGASDGTHTAPQA